MISKKSRDVAARAKQLYEQELKPQLETSSRGDFVAIEPESGQYFVAKTLSAAIQAARSAFPDRIAFALRIGDATTVDMGGVEH